MRRREFIRPVGGIAVIPLGAHAQQGERMRRVGVIMNIDNADQPQSNAVFLQVLQQAGGSMAAMCGSTPAGLVVVPVRYVSTRMS